MAQRISLWESKDNTSSTIILYEKNQTWEGKSYTSYELEVVGTNAVITIGIAKEDLLALQKASI